MAVGQRNVSIPLKLNRSNEDSTSVRSVEQLDILFFTVLMPLVSVIGIIGNILTIFILSKYTKNPHFYIGMAVADLFFLLCASVQVGITNNCIFNNCGNINIFDSMLIVAVSYLGIVISWDIILAMTVERCFAVYKPLKLKLLFTTKTVLKIIIAVYSVHIIFFIPVFYSLIKSRSKILESDQSLSGFYSVIISLSDENLTAYPIVIHSLQKLTYFAIVVGNIILVVGYRRNTCKNLDSLSEHTRAIRRKQSKRFTRLSITTGVVMMITCLPMEVMIMSSFILMKHSNLTKSMPMKYCAAFSILLAMINSGKSFFINYARNSEFREKLRNYIFKKGHNRAQGNGFRDISREFEESSKQTDTIY